jgi:hypothetical protein
VVARNAVTWTTGDTWTFEVDPIPGDANADGVVNFNDLLVLAKNYNSAPATWSQGDFNGDRAVNFYDLLILSKNYNQTAPTPAPAAASSVMTRTAPVTPEVLTDPTPDKKRPPFSTQPLAKPKPVPVKRRTV